MTAVQYDPIDRAGHCVQRKVSASASSPVDETRELDGGRAGEEEVEPRAKQRSTAGCGPARGATVHEEAGWLMLCIRAISGAGRSTGDHHDGTQRVGEMAPA